MMENLILYAEYLLLGLVSGTAGGLIGIGGGAIVVPALTLIFSKDVHLAIAASLVQMVFVASSSAYGHYKNGYILKNVVVRLVPVASVCAIIGVFIGSKVPSAPLQRVFAVFLAYTAGDTLYRLVRGMVGGHGEEVPLREFTPTNKWAIPSVAAPMGLSCGILGIGGGSIAVPALHMFLRLPLKNAIANSAAAIFFSSILASIVKVVSIEGMPMAVAAGGVTVLHWYDAVIVGLLLAPGSFVGGRIGAHLVKRAPTKVIRIVFIAVLLYSAHDMWTKAQRKPEPAPTAVAAPAIAPNSVSAEERPAGAAAEVMP